MKLASGVFVSLLIALSPALSPAALVINPVSAPASAAPTLVTGSGARANGPVELFVNGVSMGSVQADGTGAWSMTVDIKADDVLHAEPNQVWNFNTDGDSEGWASPTESYAVADGILTVTEDNEENINNNMTIFLSGANIYDPSLTVIEIGYRTQAQAFQGIVLTVTDTGDPENPDPDPFGPQWIPLSGTPGFVTDVIDVSVKDVNIPNGDYPAGVTGGFGFGFNGFAFGETFEVDYIRMRETMRFHFPYDDDTMGWGIPEFNFPPQFSGAQIDGVANGVMTVSALAEGNVAIALKHNPDFAPIGGGADKTGNLNFNAGVFDRFNMNVRLTSTNSGQVFNMFYLTDTLNFTTLSDFIFYEPTYEGFEFVSIDIGSDPNWPPSGARILQFTWLRAAPASGWPAEIPPILTGVAVTFCKTTLTDSKAEDWALHRRHPRDSIPLSSKGSRIMAAQDLELPTTTNIQAGLEATMRLVESAYRFETPERLPFLFWESPRTVDPFKDRFADPHSVEMQLNRWGDWEQQAQEFLQGVQWWETQQYSPLAPRMLIPLFCPQETILTPLGVPFSRLDENRIRIDHGQPIVQTVADIERLESLEEGFLERGLVPELLARAKWLVERTGRQHAVCFPDYQSPLGLASKLMDSTEFVYWMVDDPESIQRLLRLMSRLIAKLLTALQSAVGTPDLVQAPYLMPASVRGAIWDDYVSILGPDTYCRIVPDVNDELLQQYGGGHLHTCGPCVGPITNAILANQNVKSFDVIFANAARERFTSHILDLKKRCAGRAVLNVIGMPYDLENFTPEFVNRVNEGGGVIFTACGGSREQLLRWHDIIDQARN